MPPDQQPAAGGNAPALPIPDGTLIALGAGVDALTRANCALPIELDNDDVDILLDVRSAYEAQILATPAKTVAGIAVKLAVAYRYDAENIEEENGTTENSNFSTKLLWSALTDARVLAGSGRADLGAIATEGRAAAGDSLIFARIAALRTAWQAGNSGSFGGSEAAEDALAVHLDQNFNAPEAELLAMTPRTLAGLVAKAEYLKWSAEVRASVGPWERHLVALVGDVATFAAAGASTGRAAA